jgi:hypothetical protein
MTCTVAAPQPEQRMRQGGGGLAAPLPPSLARAPHASDEATVARRPAPPGGTPLPRPLVNQAVSPQKNQPSRAGDGVTRALRAHRRQR